MSVLRETGVEDALSDEVYEAIEQAAMESGRGRWFLQEYARRHRATDTQVLLDAIARLETALLGRLSEPSSRSGDSMRYFKQDEDLFEPADVATTPPQAKLNIVPTPGSKPTSEQDETTIKNRIVFIRRPSSQVIEIPLAGDSPEVAVG